MKETILKMSDITKVFSTEEMETHALRGINLEIYKGDFVSICGPSGCGKSTLLSILGLLDMPAQGVMLLKVQKSANLA